MTNIYSPSPDKQLSAHFFRTQIDGLLYFIAPKHHDERGYFSEMVLLPELEQLTLKPFTFKQANIVRSNLHVVRGLHAEGWNKLVTVISGKAFCALADLRKDSPQYLHVETFQLGFDHQPDQGSGLYIPQGIANSVCVLEAPLTYLYLVDKLYSDRSKIDELSISLHDPQLNIEWPLERDQMIISKRDREALTLKQFEQTLQKQS
ncbi:MAG TPA: dTDP-4-dehydrorhamnose 3,5-epimerase [Candidatus Woesebacteria bacterium]|nr:dTDP-4-dehydrorhamnose 3,5-epimerase [Candidatus Woesebacteria bacterium]